MSGSLQRIWRVQRQLPGYTSSRWWMTSRWHKLILCDISTQTYQQASTKKKFLVKPRPPQHNNDASERQQVPSYHINNYKKSFATKNVYKNKHRCQKCGISIHIEGFQCPAKKYQCKSCQKYGHFTSLCYQKKQIPFMLRKLKAHMLQTGAVYVCDKLICNHSED